MLWVQELWRYRQYPGTYSRIHLVPCRLLPISEQNTCKLILLTIHKQKQMFIKEFLINEAKSFYFWNINFEDYLSRNNRNIPPLTQYRIVHKPFLEAFYTYIHYASHRSSYLIVPSRLVIPTPLTRWVILSNGKWSKLHFSLWGQLEKLAMENGISALTQSPPVHVLCPTTPLFWIIFTINSWSMMTDR